MSCVEPTFAARLRATMEARGVTVAQLEEACDFAFSIRTIFRWRSGTSAPGIEALPLLARALRCSCDWLLGVGDELEPTTPQEEK